LKFLIKKKKKKKKIKKKKKKKKINKINGNSKNDYINEDILWTYDYYEYIL